MEEASRADLKAFLGDLLRRRASVTAATRYKALRTLYRWLEVEEEIEAGGDRSVTEVCFAVGCSSLGTFSTRFTELVGLPPSVYRRQAAGLPSCGQQVTRPVRNREAPASQPQVA